MKIKHFDLFCLINKDGSQHDVSDVLDITNLSKISKVIPVIDVGIVEMYEIRRRPVLVLTFKKKERHRAERYFIIFSITFLRTGQAKIGLYIT